MTTRTTTRRRGRPPKDPRASKPVEEDLIGGSTSDEKQELADGLDLGVVYGGVSASWLAHVFGMDKNTVKKKLAQGNCTIVGKNKGTPLYTIKEAASYLVPPKVDIDSYMRSLRYTDLHPRLQAANWSALTKGQNWKKKPGCSGVPTT